VKQSVFVTLVLVVSLAVGFLIWSQLPPYLQEGGPLVGVLISLSVMLLAFILERVFTLRKARGRASVQSFFKNMIMMLDKGDYDGAEGLLKKAIRLQPYNVVLYGGMVQVKFEQAQQFVKRGDKQSALIIIEEARNYISSGLQIEAENELLLSLEHMIRKLRSRIGS